jgi:hypothetical protein
MELGRIALDVPDDWEDHSLYTFVAPRAAVESSPRMVVEGFRSNVVINWGPRGKAELLEAEVSRAIDRATRDFGPVKPAISDGPKLAGNESRRIMYRFIEPGGTLALTQIQYLSILDGTALTIAFTTASLEAKNVAPLFDRIAGSLRVQEPKR